MVVASVPPPTCTLPGRTSVTVPRNTRAAELVICGRSTCLTVVASTRGVAASDAAINPAQKNVLKSFISNLLHGSTREASERAAHRSRADQVIVGMRYARSFVLTFENFLFPERRRGSTQRAPG